MKLITAIIFPAMLLGAATSALANPFETGNALTGQKIFDEHKCNSCHDKIMAGDGNKIFTRITRKVNTPDALIGQIGMCSGNVNAHFSNQETQDLAAYLNRYYKFK
ncbi:MAG: cytochrome c [Nitrosomonadales bacterium]|nr:cytochrome c [Nitrosomonadales bacterium]